MLEYQKAFQAFLSELGADVSALNADEISKSMSQFDADGDGKVRGLCPRDPRLGVAAKRAASCIPCAPRLARPTSVHDLLALLAAASLGCAGVQGS